MLLAHLMRLAASRACWTAGSSRPTSTAMMAITTNSSISVNPDRRRDRIMMPSFPQQTGMATRAKRLGHEDSRRFSDRIRDLTSPPPLPASTILPNRQDRTYERRELPENSGPNLTPCAQRPANFGLNRPMTEFLLPSRRTADT